MENSEAKSVWSESALPEVAEKERQVVDDLESMAAAVERSLRAIREAREALGPAWRYGRWAPLVTVEVHLTSVQGDLDRLLNPPVVRRLDAPSRRGVRSTRQATGGPHLSLIPSA